MTKLAENWNAVVGYEGIYQVSDRGRVQRIAGGRGAVPFRILKTHTGKRRYTSVILSRDCRPRTYSLHRLVAEAFHGLVPEGCEVNHKNGNTHDNRADNLEWVSHTENQRHSVNVLKNDIGEKHPMAKQTNASILEIRALHASGHLTNSKIAARFDTTSSNVSMIVNRKTWRHI